MKHFKYIVILLLSVAVSEAFAQAPVDNNYIKVITERSNKIVTGAGISDSVKFKKVRDIVVAQYSDLNTIYDARKAKVNDIKTQMPDDKAGANAKIALVDSNVAKQVKVLHTSYINKLNKELSADEVDKIKDGMTYRIYPITYTAYQDEIPNLTEEQKSKIKGWLLEARENAIDAESSEKKHAWFGKFKGRINNYLSAQGYDMKKEGEEWQKRIKERQAAKQ
ncbi:DUF3826 domain-containing protein [Mucilaginibacter rubeus]|uniref:DUF3826 domain-containing protein n=1 Tax=Mucilaginibacter rubeus TaxID=2027860 RepID=A0AAE6JIB4_9SPHI|nr:MULTISPECIES: DUF3826 domain-containing protein [Mucilaginibacter]QEM05282.1 DUF3826 domain-containing protein [Mucilaginibacter rubeus]QEM17873.1 DUF3826 domain-containing protein [Mucilaginibacter gossypii]QTE45594.1 DUF3826 domain-containing protein [Mucilaginibacter rubeus]QTE52191.1 DUF3826 domain-containing protein [Mucilaginibacter rubeus]QTE57279.1 DUF3826 domain-containing protein [Mucilaginibacter rubeus]